ncbi:MAG: hypothetical protein AAF656_01665 [Planctomycetota bacterium]
MNEPTDAFDEQTHALLVQAADRARSTPGMLGDVLRRAAELDGVADVAEVVGRLVDGRDGATPELIDQLSLCRCPAGTTLPADAARIAEVFGLDWAALIALIRKVEVTAAIGGGGGGGAGSLAARADHRDGGSDDA